MLDINVYSVINSIIGACILIILCLFLEKLVVRRKITCTVYFFLIPFLLARLLFPFEIVNRTNFIQVSKVLPSIIQFFRTELLGLPFPSQGLHISINMITLAALFLPFISVLRCLKVASRYYYLYKRLKYISPSHDERILKILADIQEKKNFKFSVRIIQNRFVGSPFEFGFFKQTICLPFVDYSDEELYFILTHELYHFKSRSNWLKFLNNVLAAIFWWNPLISFYHASVTSIIEINCDEYATMGFSDHLKAKYLACLLKELDKGQEKKESQFIHFLSSDSNSLSKRFQFLTGKHRKSKILCGLSAFAIVTAFFASYFFMVLPYFDVPASEIQTPKFTKENSYMIRKGDSYVIYFDNEPYIYLDCFDEFFSDLPIIEKTTN